MPQGRPWDLGIPAAYGGDGPAQLIRACQALRQAALSTSPAVRFGALLAGPTGAGKSSVAAWLLRRWIAKQAAERTDTGIFSAQDFTARVSWLDALEATDAERRYRLGSGDPEELERAYSADWGVLDDGGRSASPALIQLILARRYAAARPTIVTTGLTPDELVAHIGAASIFCIVEFEGKPGLLVDAFKAAA